jgi:molybdenum cofactor cytidylyltransferase
VPAPPVGILLAAGLGTRFDPGGARLKLLEPVAQGPHAGAPIAAAAARNLRRVLPRVIAVVRPLEGPLQVRLRDLLAAEGCTLLECARSPEGMGASLACGIRASADADGWIVALADMPAIAPQTIAAVAAALAAGHAAAAPFHRGQRGHPVGFGSICGPELTALGGDEGARSVLSRHPPARVEVDDPGCLLDIDEPPRAK